MQARTDSDLNTIMDALTEQWNKTTDTEELLKSLHHHYHNGDPASALLLTAAQPSTKNSRAALKKCLDLVKALAKNKNTDIKELIRLLTDVSTPSKKNAAGHICTNHIDNGSEYVERYLEIFHIIAGREDLTADDIRKLIVHHDERGQERGKEYDGSIVFDLVRLEEEYYGDCHLLETYLLTLNKLAAAGKLDSNTIYNALRTPLGCKNNIGTKIAEYYSKPECFLQFTKLCEYLAPTQIDQLFPSNYQHFRNYYLKDRVCQYIEKLPTPEEQIAVCERARDKETALGRFMHMQRNPNGLECDESRGASKRLKVLYGNALVAKAEQDKKLTKVRANAPLPSAPPLTENEYVALFSKQPPEGYLESGTEEFQLREPDAIGKALRFAAGYKNNESLARLLKRDDIIVDYCVDIGDMCKDATALYIAAEQNNIEGVRLLLARGANPNYVRQIGMTPLCTAAVNGCTEIAKILMDHGAETNVATRFKNTPLYFAARQGRAEIIELLVNDYCQRYANDVAGLAAFLQKDSHLLHSIEDVKDGKSLLALAKLTDFLAEKGVEKDVINAMIPQEYTFKNYQLKESLKDAIADIPGSQRRDVCDIGINNPDSLLYKVLWMKRGGLLARDCRVEAGVLAEVKEIRDTYTHPVEKIHLALSTYMKTNNAAVDHSDFEQALKDGADANIEIEGFPALIYAAVRGDTKLVELLIQHGADRHFSKESSHNGIRSLIRNRGCDKSRSEKFIQENIDNKTINLTAEDYARLCMFDETAEVLRKHREAQEEKAAAVTERDGSLAFVPPVAEPVKEAQPPIYEEATVASTEEVVVVDPAPVTEKIYPTLPPMTNEYYEKQKAYFNSLLQPQKIAVTVEEVKDAVKPESVRTYVNPFEGIDEPIEEKPPAYNPFGESIPADVDHEEPIAVAEATDPFANIDKMLAPKELDPFEKIDLILNAETPAPQPSWISALKDIDFSPEAPSSTALMLERLGDLISFDEPVVEPVKAKPYVNPFADLVEQPTQEQAPAIKKSVHPFIDSLAEQKRDAEIAKALDALPPAPKEKSPEKKQKEDESKSGQKKRVMVSN